MPIKLPEGQETTDYKGFMARNQREALRETIAAYKKVSSYGSIVSHILQAIQALVDAGIDIHEAIRTHDCKVKVRPAKGEDTSKVGVKFYLNDADMNLLRKLSELAGLERQDFLHLILFGTERPRKKRQTDAAKFHKVSTRFEDDDFALGMYVKDATVGSEVPFSVFMRDEFLERMADKFEALEAN